MSETRESASGQHRPAGNAEAEAADGTTPPSPRIGSTRAGKPSKEPETLLDQMGGVSGIAYSAIPIVAFVLVNSLAGLMPAIWAAIAIAVALAVVRVIRKEPLQPAISGVLGVVVCSFIAYHSGEAKGFFLLGIWTSLVYGGIFLISVVARWPLVGVAWSMLNGLGSSWRQQRKALTAYDLATLAWTLVFAAKFVVQQWLYAADLTGWLAFARIAGYALTALALVVTIWAIKRAKQAAAEAAAAPS